MKLAILFLLAAAGPAVADPIEIDGIELQLPVGWGHTRSGKATLLAPIKFPNRAISVMSIKKVPDATTAAVQEAVGDKFTIEEAHELKRNGLVGVEATGNVVTDKVKVEMDLIFVPVNDGGTMLVSVIEAGQDPVLRKANTDVLASVTLAGPKLSVVYTPLKKGGIPKAFADELTAIAPKLDALLIFPRPLPIKIAPCGVVNAFYSPRDHEITLCHELWDDLIALFTKAGEDAKTAEENTRGTYLFAFFHEFGHALEYELALPITGKGEDAADQLATIVLSDFGPEGKIAALEATQWFDTMVAQPDHEDVFWDEHSFDQQRSVAIMCLLYGADPDRFAPLMKARGIPASRSRRCVNDYKSRVAAWTKLLAPYERSAKK